MEKNNVEKQVLFIIIFILAQFTIIALILKLKVFFSNFKVE